MQMSRVILSIFLAVLVSDHPTGGEFSEFPLTTLVTVINQDTVPPGKLKAFPPQPPCSPRKSVGYNGPASRELLPGYAGWSVPLMQVLCGQSNLFTNMCTFGNEKKVLVIVAFSWLKG